MTTRIHPAEWSDPRQRLGLEIELRVARWLAKRGWRIETHRFQLGRNDLDLVARMGSLVAFIEVKARRSPRCGMGEEAVTHKKRATIERLAWSWILRHGVLGDQYRFDVIAVEGQSGREKVRHLEDAWRPGWR